MTIFLETLRMSLKMFKTNKLRTFLTMLGIIVGIFSVTVILAVSDGTKNKMMEEFEELDKTTISLNFSDLYSKTGEIKEKTMVAKQDIYNIAKESKVIKNVTLSSQQQWREFAKKISDQELENLGNEGSNVMIDEFGNSHMMMNERNTNQLTIGYDYFNVKGKVNQDNLIAGRLFTAFDELNHMNFTVISEEVANLYFKSAHQAINQRIYINGIDYKVIGVLAISDPEIGEWDEKFVYPAYVLNNQEMISAVSEGDYGRPSSFIFKVDKKEDRTIAKEEIKNYLSDIYLKDQYNIDMGYQDQSDVTNNIMDMITMVFAGIAGLSLVVGGIGIMNIMLVSVNERIREIGIRQALGAKRSYILIQFLMEAVLLTLGAGIIGMLLAQGAVSVINAQDYGIILSINIKVMIYVVLFCAAVGILFGFYPANKASKLNIADTLRYE